MLRLPLHVILCALLGTAASSARAESPTAPEIVDDYIETQVVDSEFAYLSLKRFRGGELLDEKRLLAMTRKDQGKRASLMRLTRPEDLEGVTTLFLDQPSREADVYLYMPEIGEAKQVKGADLTAAFLGSDFSLEDMLREIPGENEYTRLRDAVAHGEACYVVKAVPKDPDSAYSRRTLHISQETHQLLRIEFYRGTDQPVKSFDAYGDGPSHVKRQTRRPEPAAMINPVKGTTTVITAIESRLNEELDAGMFTAQGITQIQPEDVDQLLRGFQFTTTFSSP